MRINSISTNNFVKNSKPSFGAVFSEELEYKYKKLGYEILFRTGQDSKEYQIYEASIKGLKRLCPDGTLKLSKNKDEYGIFLQSPYIKSEQVYSAPFKYQLFDLEGLKQTVSNLALINRGYYNGLNYSGSRKDVVEHIQKQIAPVIDKLF